MGNEGSQVKVDNADGVEDGDLIVISYPPNGWQEIFMVTKLGTIIINDPCSSTSMTRKDLLIFW